MRERAAQNAFLLKAQTGEEYPCGLILNRCEGGYSLAPELGERKSENRGKEAPRPAKRAFAIPADVNIFGRLPVVAVDDASNQFAAMRQANRSARAELDIQPVRNPPGDRGIPADNEAQTAKPRLMTNSIWRASLFDMADELPSILCPLCSTPWANDNIHVWDVAPPTYTVAIICHSCRREIYRKEGAYAENTGRPVGPGRRNRAA